MIRRSAILILLLSLFNLAAAQVPYGRIHVKVLDAESDQPIPYTNVFLSQTTIGGYTDANGEIDVNRIPVGSYQLVISEISHKLQQRKLTITGEQTVYITVKLLVKMLEEVQVTARRDAKWRRELKRFEKLFFGFDNFKKCEITNPWVLNFTNIDHKFTAEAREPLKIQNNYLGYDLQFTLKTCVFTSSDFSIKGVVKFDEKKGDEAQIKKWKRNRDYVYQGSPQHFFKAVVDSAVQAEGYKVYQDITNNPKIVRGSTLASNVGNTVVPDTITRDVMQIGKGMYMINVPKRLEVHYLQKRAKPAAYIDIVHPITWMEVKSGKVKVNRNGIVQNPEDLTVSGMMSDLKVADWLPENYKEPEQPKAVVPVFVQKEKRPTFLEKPYVQTDRDYYYSGESIWFKGYMSYNVPLLKDTMSLSIYVELADAGGHIVAKKRYPVEGGKFTGDIFLEKHLAAGPYQLKTYTAWMLNFDKRFIFTKTINVLAEKEAVKVIADYQPPTDTSTNIWLRTDKTQYSAREKVTVLFDTFDSLEFPSASDLSMSVTDISQAVPHRNEKTILTNYLYDELDADEETGDLKYDIEYGIDFSGQFWVGKRPVQASITVFQENVKETFAIVTSDSGRFKQTLIFKDTLNLYLRATTARSQRGIVRMDTLRPVCPQLALEPLPLDIYTSNVSHAKALNLTGATLLEEVAITAKKIKDEYRPASVIHGTADFTVTGDWINDHNFNDIGYALQSRVPGFKFNFDYMNPSFMLNNSSIPGVGGGGPLIVIDGQAFNNPSDGARAAMAIPIRSIERVDILKYGSAAAYGSRAANGVIVVITKKWHPREPGDTSFDKENLQKVRWAGYSTASTFVAPDYSQPQVNDYLDYRSTVFWAPAIATNGKDPATVTFYAGDIATKYRIVVEGVTIGGEPIHAEKIIEVVKGR